ncbi:DUF4440 domain-containing protein [Microbacterium sp. NPDC090218]
MTTVMTFGTGARGAAGWAWRIDGVRWRLSGSTDSDPIGNELRAIGDALTDIGRIDHPVRIRVQHPALAAALADTEPFSALAGLRAGVGARHEEMLQLERAVERFPVEFGPAGPDAVHPGEDTGARGGHAGFVSTDASDALREKIVDLESVLLSAEGRSDEKRLEELIHRDFYEIGRSGRYWLRDEVISTLLGIPDQVQRVTFDRVVELAPGVAHVRFRTEDAVGIVHRSSIWMRDGERWRQRYHQGTPDTQ